MRRLLPLLLGAIATGAFAAPADPPVVRFVEFDTTVHMISARRIVNAIDDAEAEGDALVLIRLDTPGGELQAAHTIIKRILASKVPVVAWVGPPGAHAASAGFLLLIAADVAAMAPGTRTGAAATVFGTGEGTEDNVLLKKMNEDNAALLRSVAGRRGRNPEASEEAVFSAKAFEESVALERGLIDLIASDRDELLAVLHGREVRRFDGETVVLETESARIVTSQRNFRDEVLEILGSPTLAYLLFMLGMLGLYIEFSHPGAILPGVVGAICLLLFAFAAQVLPVSSVGMLLILLAAVLFVLEVKVVSFGLLTLAGTACLIVGSMMLIDGPIPELRVPPGLVWPASLVVAALCAVAVRFAWRAHRAAVATGNEGLRGALGEVSRALDPAGKVFVHGEIWDARSPSGTIAAGTRVRVVDVDALSLTVEPVDHD